MTVQLDIGTIIYIASCISILAAAVKVLYSAKKALLKPLEDVNKKLQDHDRFLANDKNQLEKIDYVLVDLTRSINMLVKSHRIVLRHLQEGNHTGEITAEIDELDKWLLEGKEYKKG